MFYENLQNQRENVENFNSNLRALEFPVIDAVHIDEIPPAQADQ